MPIYLASAVSRLYIKVFFVEIEIMMSLDFFIVGHPLMPIYPVSAMCRLCTVSIHMVIVVLFVEIDLWHIIGSYDFFIVCHPLMPIYLASAVSCHYTPYKFSVYKL